MLWTFSLPPRVSDPDMHHGTCVMHVTWCMPGSQTNCFLWSPWQVKRSRFSRRMHNPQFYVSGKRPMLCGLSRQVVIHDRENRHNFVNTRYMAKFIFLLLKDFLVSSDRFHCIQIKGAPILFGGGTIFLPDIINEFWMFSFLMCFSSWHPQGHISQCHK